MSDLTNEISFTCFDWFCTPVMSHDDSLALLANRASFLGSFHNFYPFDHLYSFSTHCDDRMASPPSTTATEEFGNKELLDRVRPLLQRDKIRLWEPPYTDSSTGAENIPQASYTNSLSPYQ